MNTEPKHSRTYFDLERSAQYERDAAEALALGVHQFTYQPLNLRSLNAQATLNLGLRSIYSGVGAPHPVTALAEQLRVNQTHLSAETETYRFQRRVGDLPRERSWVLDFA